MVAMIMLPRPARAHGGGPGLDYDPCAARAGADNYVHFAAYQPEYNRFAEYCDGVPLAGSTLLVFDLVGNDLISAPVALAVVDKGGAARLSIPARRYPSGVIDVETNLPTGEYRAWLTIGQAPQVYRVDFDLAVGVWWQPLVAPLVLAALVLMAAAAYCLLQARSSVAAGSREPPDFAPRKVPQERAGPFANWSRRDY
jgi:hypothetical protein